MKINVFLLNPFLIVKMLISGVKKSTLNDVGTVKNLHFCYQNTLRRSIMDETEYRIKELERKVRGMQVQIEKGASINKKHEKAIRDLEIKNAVKSGVSQRKVAEIYDLSAARVSQIARKAV